MINTIFATKKNMSQVWDSNGKRIPITKFKIEPNYVVGEINTQIKTDKKDANSWTDQKVLEIGYGQKKLKNVSHPLRSRLKKLSLNTGLQKFFGIRDIKNTDTLNLGSTVPYQQIFKVGDLVQVKGRTKGRGFAGGMKRHGFHGGPKTHGQSDRARAVGSIGNRTTPGRVWLGKKMPGHYGSLNQTVKGLIVAHLDEKNHEIWLTGPVPGAFNGIVAIKNTNQCKKNFKLDLTASKIAQSSDTTPVAQKETK